MSAARTLPVTPAERACAAVLRAYLAWIDTPEDVPDDGDWEASAVLEDLGEALDMREFLAHEGGPSPAGAALLARVEAAPVPDPMIAFEAAIRDAVAKGGPYGNTHAREAVASLDAARLAGTAPIDAPANAYKIGPISAGRVVTAVSTPTRIHTAAGSVVELLPGESVEIEPCPPAKEPR